MDKYQAQNIIRETFEKPFETERFSSFIRNLLNQPEDAYVPYRGNYVPDAYKPYISSLVRLYKYSDGEHKIDVLVAQLKRETLLERARTMQRNFIAWYLNGSRGGEMKDAALVAFVSPGEADWRFSLVKMDYRFEEGKDGKIKVREEFTPARRWSFLVGSNESSHTAQSRLVPILADVDHNPTLAKLEEAFNIETVSKEFFLKYRDLFLRTKEALDKVVEQDAAIKADFDAKGVDTVNFAKRLLGQIVFLYFLQKKGWFGVGRDDDWGTGSKQFLRELFECKHCQYKNFFNDILEPLFYEALRIGEERKQDDYYYSRFNCKIPFLNGGLFDPIGNYDWVHTDIYLPNELFSNNKRTKEGDIGDGILDIFDRYNFTVKEDEPLEKEVAIDPELLGKTYEKFNAIRPDNFDEFIKALKSGRTGEENKFNKKFGVYYTPREIVHYMCQQSLINYLHTELNKGPISYHKIGETQTSALGNEAKRGQLDLIVENRSTSPIRKEDIETLIKFGEHVSEHEAAVQAKGRETRDYSYKLPESIRKNAQLIDRALANITVCDPAVGSGAFPVGMMHEIVKARQVLETYIQAGKTAYDFKRECIEKSLYGVDIDPGAVEIAKLRLWLSLVVDEEDIRQIKPLPNLDYKIVRGNSLLGVKRDLLNDHLFKDLEKQKPLHFNETNPTKKQEYRKQIDELISQITNGHTEFDFEVYFSEVFHEKGGFDVVIANPPYGSELNKNEKLLLDQKFNKYKSAVKNSAIYFTYKTLELLNKRGIHTYIVPKSISYSVGWHKCANFVLQGLIKLIDTGKAFDDVKLEQVIFVRVNGVQDSNYINGLYDGYKVIEFTEVTKDIFNKSNVLLTGQTHWELNMIYRILAKFNSKWGDYVSIKRGLNWQSKVKKHGSVPIYRGEQLSPYHLDKPRDFIDLDEFERNEYSYQFKPKILNQLAIAHVQNPYPHFYLQAALDLENKLVFETISCTFVKNNLINIKFLLGINNAKLFAWLLYKFVYSNAIRSTRYDERYVGKVPCPPFESINQKPIIGLVDKILAITKDEDYLQNPQKQAKVKALEREIDQIVYQLYGLTEEEIKIVEGKK